MLSHIRISQTEDIHRNAVASSHPFYNRMRDLIYELFVRSIETPFGSPDHPELQLRLLVQILAVERVFKRCRRYERMLRSALKSLADNGAPVERKKHAQFRIKEMEDYQVTARWIIDRLRAIGDGMAWRMVEYDRIAIRLLADHEPVSVPQIDEGLVAELGALENIVSNSSKLCLLNSITNLLRTGDITTYDPDTRQLDVVEVKAAGQKGKRRNRRTLWQTDHRQSIQIGLDTGSYLVDGRTLTKLVSKLLTKSYVRSVGNAIREAKQKGVASRLFGDYLAVAILDFNQGIKNFSEDEWPKIWRSATDRLSKVKKIPQM